MTEGTTFTGTVLFYSQDKCFGFIKPDDGGADIFLHKSEVDRSSLAYVTRDDRVKFRVEKDRRGRLRAVDLEALR